MRFTLCEWEVSEWLDMPVARSYRESLQTCPVVHQREIAQAYEKIELDEASQRRVMKRSAWLQAYCRYGAQTGHHGIYRADLGVLSGQWPKALEAIAKTWGRLLTLVGLRW